MYCFAEFDSDGNVESISISAFKTETETENAYYISEEECLRLKQEMAEKIAVENAADETVTYDELLEQNAALEAENAALLYQVLTGEELTDV